MRKRQTRDSSTSKEIPLSGTLAKLESRCVEAGYDPDNLPDLSQIPCQEPPGQLQLPLWPDHVRGVPNSILRSALFSATKKGKRAYINGQKVASYGHTVITQSGPRLDQPDCDVWEQCLHLARIGGLGNTIQFSSYGFLKAIGRPTGGSGHLWLRSALLRLTGTVVEVTENGAKTYFGPLIHHGARNEQTNSYTVVINPAIYALFAQAGGWTAIQWQQRMALKKKPLAQWLHGFYSTHAAPFPLKIETIMRLCGSEARQIKHFSAELREAMADVVKVTGWTWNIDEHGLFSVTRPELKKLRTK